jgi:hypothetical protein
MKKSNTQLTAVKEVMKEFNTLKGAKQSFTTQDIVELRKYAQLRTDLSLPEDELTEEQKVWKMLYGTFDKSLEDMLSVEEKTKIDDLVWLNKSAGSTPLKLPRLSVYWHKR